MGPLGRGASLLTASPSRPQVIFRFALALFKYKEEEILKLQDSMSIFKYLRYFTRTVLDARCVPGREPELASTPQESVGTGWGHQMASVTGERGRTAVYLFSNKHPSRQRSSIFICPASIY